jgi:hypothetical protein
LHAIADHIYSDLAMRNLVAYMIRLILKSISFVYSEIPCIIVIMPIFIFWKC